MSDDDSIRGSDIRAIRTAIVGLALAVMAAALAHIGDPMGFSLFVVMLVVLAYSFVQTMFDL